MQNNPQLNTRYPDQHTRRSRSRPSRLVGLAIVAAAFLVGACCLVASLTAVGVEDYNQSPRVYEGILRPDTTPPSYALSADQQAAVSMHGYPDSFTILFYEDEFPAGTDGTTRMETWAYYGEGVQISFVNGQQQGEDALPASRDIYSPEYRPEQFTAYMSLEELLAATGLDSLMVVPLEEELVPGGESFFADQLTFGLKDDRLLYVETIAFEDLAGAAAEPSGEPSVTMTRPPDGSVAAFLYDQGHGWILPYLADPAAANSPEPNVLLADFATALDLQGETAYDLLVGYMAHREWATLDDWMAAWDDPTAETWVTSWGYDLTYMNFDDAIRLWDFAEAYGWASLPEYLASQGVITIHELLDLHGHDTLGAFLAGNGVPSSTHPILFTSTRGDPDFPACQETDEGCASRIYLLNPINGEVTRVTRDDSLEWEGWAAWSPDRWRLAFTAGAEGNGDIYVVNADGSDLLRLTTGPEFDGFPTWSPGGSQIAFMTDRDGNWDIHLMDSADGANRRALTTLPSQERFPDWSPQADLLVFHSTAADDGPEGCWPDCNTGVYTLEIDGPMRQLTDSSGSSSAATWSPDGSRIAFHSNRDGDWEIYVMNADGSSVVQLTDNEYWDGSPNWSPDGSMLAFYSDRAGNGDMDIYIMNADGSGVTRLTDHPADDFEPGW